MPNRTKSRTKSHAATGLAAGVALLAAPALGQGAAGPGESVTEAWAAWAEAQGIAVTTLAVLAHGKLVAEEGIGTDAGTPRPVASLSKPITAACAAAIPGLTSQTRVGDLLGDLLDGAGPAADATLAQLLTHSSGIAPDSTQGNPALIGVEATMIREVAAESLSRDPQEGTPGSYAYNNENYALIGAMIEAASGQSYVDACNAALIEPLGLATATLSGPWMGQGSWGGWQISAADLARFAWSEYGPEGRVGADPAARPRLELGDGLATTEGVLTVPLPAAESDLFWSTGLLCWGDAGDGGYFASYGNGVVVAVTFAGCIAEGDALQALDAALFEAAAG
ncbi:serine hydrolase domain-containing protein [Pseudoroseicyclus sp. CXY001]|uniref:serine hydrolase domain-containing protein n=1 Tax=Pseudoroseicyclus sp. CXY001 TaxID=3242492 RepID=UPI00358DAFDF